MPYPDSRNPREVRAALDNSYARYMHGEDMFPSHRLVADAEYRLPAKSVAIARRLRRTWDLIDTDRSYFKSAVVGAFDTLQAKGEPASGLVITCIGRNAVGYAQIQAGDKPTTTIGIFPRDEFEAEFNDHNFDLENGLTIPAMPEVGDNQATGIISRRGTLTGIYTADPDLAIALMGNVTRQPVYPLRAS